MEVITVKSFSEYISKIEEIIKEKHQIVLYRGQSQDSKLLPNIARENPTIDTTETEIEMLEELKRRSLLLINRNINSNWEWLIFAQHFGLKTRLLDWSSNPLTALWFACKNEYFFEEPSYVYILKTDNSMLVDYKQNESPFQHPATRVLRPLLNNERIVAQSGWFTAHKFHKSSRRFVPLEENQSMKKLITKIHIPAEAKIDILKSLAIFGTNNRTVFPDITGLCEHLNWTYREKLKGSR